MDGDLSEEPGWASGFAGKCTDAGLPSDCLHMSVLVSVVGPDGTPTSIPDPGPAYDHTVYDSCLVTAITPPPPATVPVGTTVVIEVLCQPVAAAGAGAGAGAGAAG